MNLTALNYMLGWEGRKPDVRVSFFNCLVERKELADAAKHNTDRAVREVHKELCDIKGVISI